MAENNQNTATQTTEDSLVLNSLIHSLPDELILKLSCKDLSALLKSLNATPEAVVKIKDRRRLLQSRRDTINSREKSRKFLADLKQEKTDLLAEKLTLVGDIQRYKDILDIEAESK